MCRIIDGNTEILLTLISPHSFCGNKWCIPGGHLNENENPIDGGIRELCEETGIDLRSIRNKVKKLFVHKLNEHRAKFGATYVCILPKNFKYTVSVQPSEVSEARWFDIQKFPMIILHLIMGIFY